LMGRLRPTNVNDPFCNRLCERPMLLTQSCTLPEARRISVLAKYH